MASIHDLKPAFQKLLRPLVRRLADAGMTANQITVAAALLSLLGGGIVMIGHQARWPLLVVPVVLFMRMGLNAVDGMLALEHDMKSALGAVLNEIGDVLSDLALYLPFGLLSGVWPLLAGLVVSLAVVSEMAGVVALQIGAERRYDGPMGKSDRAFAFGALATALGLGVPTGAWLNLVFASLAVLLAATIVNRLRSALRQVPS